VYAKVRRKFSPEDISLLSVLGDQAALAIHKAQLYEETRAQKEEATKLYGITAHLATTLDVDSVLDQVVAKTIDLLAATPPQSTSTTRRAGASWFAGAATWIPPSFAISS
jgi:GAF domain-containing protein